MRYNRFDGESLANRVNAACDAFEKQLMDGERPTIEGGLQSWREPERYVLICELLAIELLYRRQASEHPDVKEYFDRFPIEIVRSAFRRVDQLTEPVRFSTAPEAETALFENDMRAEPISPLSVAKKFGNYEIIGEIARGGMGVVYKARQVSLNRIVALKMIKSGDLAGAEEVQRFRTEAETAAQLDHPHIVPIYEVGEQNGQHFFSMGLVDGQGLDVRLTKGPLPPREAAALIKTIAEAVHFAHEKGIVHRDLKPANVLIDSDDKPRITDFGLAKYIAADSGMTATGQVMGTPSYMPPEQAAGKTESIGPLADVYSLGAMLYALLTGRPPFQAANIMETLKQVLEQEPLALRKLNPAIPRDLETICLKSLRKDPTHRYATARELFSDLGRWLHNKPIVARRTGPVLKSWLWCKRKPAIAGSLVALLLVVVSGLLIGRALIRDRDRQAVNDNNATTASGLVNSLLNADIAQVPGIIKQIEGYREWADPMLKEKHAAAKPSSPEKLRLSLALLPQDKRQVGYLQDALLNADAASLPVILDAIRPHGGDIAPALWMTLASKTESKPHRFNAACALASFAGVTSSQWRPFLPLVANQLIETLSRSPKDFGVVVSSLEPIRKRLADPLASIVRDAKRSELQREIALNIVLAYASDDPGRLAEVMADSERWQFEKSFEGIAKQRVTVVGHLERILKEKWNEKSPEHEKERIAKRQTIAAIALLRLNQPAAVWPLLRSSPDPRARSYIIHWAAPLGVKSDLFIKRIGTESDTSIRRALLLTLGEYAPAQLSRPDRETLLRQLLTVIEIDPDPGIHGCTEWLLRKWGYGKKIRDIVKSLRENETQRLQRLKGKNRRWYVNGQGQTFSIVTAGSFRMGSPKSESERETNEVLRVQKINRTFAIASHEVTRSEFRRFQKELKGPYRRFGVNWTNQPVDSPQCAVDWYDAAAYCNWLSAKEGISKSEWCYEENSGGKFAPGMSVKNNYLKLLGYRLPTDAEWEFACRSGTETSRYHGNTGTLLSQYAYYDVNSGMHHWPVGGLKPNELGLFDMLGNAFEWCQNGRSPRNRTRAPLNLNTVTDSVDRLLRGGSYNLSSSNVRAAFRFYDRPSFRYNNYGFRPARTLHFLP